MFARVTVRWLGILLALISFRSLVAQSPNDSADDSATAAQAAAADKFLQLYLARPQPGTALEKTIEYYQSIGKLDQLIKSIETQAKDAQSDHPETAARRWLAAALIVQSQGRWLESLELLKQAPDVVPLRWEIGTAQSIALEQLQRWSSIIEVMQPLIEQTQKESTQGNSTIVIEAAQRLAKAHSRVGQTAEAFKTWRAIEKRFGNDQQIAMRLANMATSEGELGFAIEVLDRILAKLPPSTKRIELAMQRTSLLARQGDESAAIAQYQELLRGLNVDSWLATEITSRIEDLIIAKDGIDALIAHYQARLQQQPDDMQIMLRLANWLDSEKRWEQSGPLFKRIIERTTTAIEPRRAYAQSLLNQELWHEAVLELEKLVALAPRDDDLLMQWCEAVLADTTVEAAVRDEQVQKILERSLADLNPSAANYQQLASRLQRFGQADRAIFWLAKAHSLKSDDLSVLSDYSRALVDLGQEELALKLLADYEQSQRESRAELAQLADLYADLDRQELAIDCLTRACQLGASTAMRFRLADWLEEANRAPEAMAQLDLAWTELPTQTKVINEQEALCEEITRRQLKLVAQLDNLAATIARLRTALDRSAIETRRVSEGAAQKPSPPSSQNLPVNVAGMPPESIAAWRLAKFLSAASEWEQAAEQVAKGLEESPNSPMLWRLRAEIYEHNNRLPDAIAARRKLAEIDVRRRSEYLLQAAKDLARMGNLDAALKLSESITTETASSQHIIEVFNLASEYGATRFSIDLLIKRYQSRPGDAEVLARLIKFYQDSGKFAQAAEYQWKNLELTRTAEQRLSAVQALIETHHQLRSLDELERKLDKFWRQHDLWREFGVWQVLVALKSNDQQRAEQLLDRLTQSQTTRRFAIEQSLKLAKARQQSLKQLQLMKQMAVIDPQTTTADELASVLTQIPLVARSRELAEDAVGMMRGPSKRLALIHDLLLAAQVDWTLRLVDVLPEQEQNSWPIMSRAALALAAYPKNRESSQPHVLHTQALLQKFVDQSLELPESLVGQPLLTELLASQTLIVEFLATSAAGKSLSQEVSSFSAESLNCTSKLHAYAAVLAAQLQLAATPEQRRSVVESHRQSAMNQPRLSERSVRLAILAIVSHWQSRAATVKDAQATLPQRPRKSVPDNELALQLRIQISKLTQAKLPKPDSSLTTRLASFSEGLPSVITQLNELADQGDRLATLLCLWELSIHQQDLLKSNQTGVLKRAINQCRNLDEYEPFAPGQILTLMAIARLKEDPQESKGHLQSLSRLALSRQELQKLLEMVLVYHDAELIDALVASQVPQTPMADLLGELLCSRTHDEAMGALDALRALDCIWRYETEKGLRNLSHLKLEVSNANFPWMQWLPMCSLPMHESSLLKQIDFALLRALVAQNSSNASRQELLKFLNELASEPTNDDLRLVRQLARIFVVELLEQDTQSAKLLDEVLPESSLNNPKLAVLRGQWLDLTGRRDAAIAWWVKIDQLPEELRERSAATLLQLAVDRHDDEATELAIKQLRAATRNLTAYRDLAGELLRRDKLTQAESLIGEFKVLLPPTEQPLVLAPSNPTVALQTPSMDESLISRWQQTDQLFVLLRKYSKSDDLVGACRIGRRLLEGARHASDEELREHLPNLVKRLSFSFAKASHLEKFLELESQRLQDQDAPSEALCVLRIIAQEKLGELAEPIVRRQMATPMNAMQYFELAECAMELDDFAAAAKLFTGGFELAPEWLETSIQRISTSPKTIVWLAKELNELPPACTGIGTATMDALFKVIPAPKLRDYPNLLASWANSLRPKSQSHMRLILTRMLKDDFDLWLKIVEQLLVADELPPMVLAYESGNLWTQPNYQPGVIEQHLLDTSFTPEQATAYQEMLQRVLVRSRDHFVARLLLMHSFIASKQMDHAADQLPLLLQSSRGLTPTKTWVIAEWRKDLAKTLAQNNSTLADATLRQSSGNRAPAEIDEAAKVKLLLHLVNSLQDRPQESDLRNQLAERMAELGGMAMLDSAQRTALLKFYVEQHDEAKVLALFESDLQRLSAPPNRRIENAFTSPTSTWSLLARSGMDWVRHLVLVRFAQIEQVPVDQSSMIHARLAADAGDSRAIIYPLKEPAVDSLKVFVAKSRPYLANALPGLWNSNSNSLVEAFKPLVVLDARSQQIQIVSMLDAIWPMGTQLADQETRAQLLEEVQTWSEDLDTLGPWSTLVLHNLAARLGEAHIVEQAQTHLMQLAKNKVLPDDQSWRIACWSAVVATTSIPETNLLRFRVGELAREAVLKGSQSQNELYVLMTIEQFDRTSDGGVRSAEEKELVERMATDVVKMVTRGAASLGPRSSRVDSASFKIHVKMFEKLMARDEIDAAIALLRTMQESKLIYGTARGIVPYNDFRSDVTVNEHVARTLPLLQRLVDSNVEPEKLQALWQELLLEPLDFFKSGMGGGTAADFPGFQWQSANPSAPIPWIEPFDPNQPLGPQAIPPNMFSQLVHLAQSNGSEVQLQSSLAFLAQPSNARVAAYVCGVMLALEMNDLPQAIDLYSKALYHRGKMGGGREDLELMNTSIFNAVRLAPLSDSAIEFSTIALPGPLTDSQVHLLRQQLQLAARQKNPKAVASIVTSLGKAEYTPLDLRVRLRDEYAIALLDAGLVQPSIDAYVQVKIPEQPRKSDRYVLELMNRLPTLDAASQAEVFECFVSRKYPQFPWLECYQLPVNEPLPKRFRRADLAEGLVFQSLDNQRSWVSLLWWIADYAERSSKPAEALESASFIGVDNAAAGWGAAALAARLKPDLTPGALKNRVGLARHSATPAAMRALLDCCQNNEALRSAAIEIILNLGFPEIALAPSANAGGAQTNHPRLANTQQPATTWQHWLTVRESTLSPANLERPRWSLAKSGQWTAQAAKEPWYLMLRYPIEGDFQLSLTAQQVSGTKFGIGCGGLAVAQPESDQAIRCLGVGGRRAMDLVYSPSSEESDVPTKIQRHGNQWSLHASSVRIDESADDIVPLIYLMNQGAGVARIADWQLTGDLKIARHVNLLDAQLRLWRTTLGQWKLPNLKVRSLGLDTTNSKDVYVNAGELHLTSPIQDKNNQGVYLNAIHCIRPLQNEESISYEFYQAADSASVHPALGRMVFRLDHEQLKLQWLTHAHETDWLGISSANSYSINANENIKPVQLKTDAWNKIRLRLTADSQVAIELNGELVARVPLPPAVIPEFGLVVSSSAAAKVRDVQLTGPWPQSLSLEELTKP